MMAGSSPAMTAEGRGCASELWMTPMEIALGEARVAAARGEVPVGAVVLDASGAVLARAGNEVEARHDPDGARRASGVARGGRWHAVRRVCRTASLS